MTDRKELENKPGMDRWYTSGGRGNTYLNPAKGIRTQVVDEKGRIRHFPGIIMEDFWVKHVMLRDLEPRVRYASYFQEKEGDIVFLWQVHPDGRYWADEDGFGWEDDWEVILYSRLDSKGRFREPFRIYSLDGKKYMNKD